ncbi:mechanosensitive ion channel protein MscS [Halobacillus halophilus]|uniref:Small-conductance mechanosensitive channel n=1 Tax=Halobacillus halophilus (strain ATCC 35676 / DSM 2266 / JCM 20832 / KCTC 3685 / LMG 17431 / NBRC 102448 / NCIMB 2269) TaxID=866895 RepID=I0JTL0_HALH3|nr:mechanosensitive ion channel protein MscS [Halobacillus halophilus]CCG47483.1 small-conductance mechanosensitive channel [Halobacillus halophilus DSM 2266]
MKADEAVQEALTRWEETVNYVTGPELWTNLALGALKIIFILLISFLVIRIGKRVISQFFENRRRGPFKITQRREATLKKLVINALTYVVYFVSFIMILEAFTLDVGALLAGAGIAGLAIGFGAQNLVRDIISGFFIIFEDQFSVGDYIRTSGVEGFVEEVGIRTCKVKSWTGEVHILPNGNVTQVTNFSIHNSVAVVDVSIAYEEDIAQAEQVILELMKELPARYEAMLDVPELLGVQTLGASDVVMRIIADTQPMEHWAMARAIRKEVKTRLDERGIEIPFPRMVMYSREDDKSLQEVNE